MSQPPHAVPDAEPTVPEVAGTAPPSGSITGEEGPQQQARLWQLRVRAGLVGIAAVATLVASIVAMGAAFVADPDGTGDDPGVTLLAVLGQAGLLGALLLAVAGVQLFRHAPREAAAPPPLRPRPLFPAPAPRRARTRGLALGAAGTAVLLLTALVVAGTRAGTMVYVDDFSTGTGRFPVEDYGNYATSYHDGAFWLTVRRPEGDTAQVDLGSWHRAAVGATLTLPARSGRGQPEGAGLLLGDDAGGFGLTLDRAGGWELRDNADNAATTLATGHGAPPVGPVTLRLVVTSSADGGTDLTGFRDGRVLVRRHAAGWHRFTRAGVLAFTRRPPLTVAVDDVRIEADQPPPLHR